MERQLARYSYWLGLAFVLISVLWRGFSLFTGLIPDQMGSVWYSSFWKVGVVCLVISIASVNHAWLKQQTAEKPAEKPIARAA